MTGGAVPRQFVRHIVDVELVGLDEVAVVKSGCCFTLTAMGWFTTMQLQATPVMGIVVIPTHPSICLVGLNNKNDAAAVDPF